MSYSKFSEHVFRASLYILHETYHKISHIKTNSNIIFFLLFPGISQVWSRVGQLSLHGFWVKRSSTPIVISGYRRARELQVKPREKVPDRAAQPNT